MSRMRAQMMKTTGEGEARRSALGARAAGLLLSIAVAAVAGAWDVVVMLQGGFDVGWADTAGVIAFYGLVGLALGAVTTLAVALAGWFDRRSGLSLSNSRVAIAVPPVLMATALFGVFANKMWIPGVLTFASMASNLAIGCAAAALVAALIRLRVARRLSAVTLSCLALLAFGTLFLHDRPDPSLATEGTGVAPEDSPTIVVALVDTLRRDHLGLYGYGRGTSPQLDLLAKQAVVFDRVFSTSNWTRPAVASLMTSTLPSQHGVIDQYTAVPVELPLLAESLARAGYRTAFFTGNANVEPEDGYSRGVGYYFHLSGRGFIGRTLLVKEFLQKDLPWLEELLRLPLEGRRRPSYSPTVLTDEALEWLASDASSSFAYLHYQGPHDPYLPPKEVAARLSDDPVEERFAWSPEGWAGQNALAERDRARVIQQYDAEVLWHDQEIGRLFRALSHRDDVVLVVLADHGEGFGEHGVWQHSNGMFDETVRVPLLMWCPAACGEPRRDSWTRSLLDLGPTILSLAGVEVPGSFAGSSLLTTLPEENALAEFAVVENPATGEYSIRSDEWNLALRQRESDVDTWLWGPGERPSQPEGLQDEEARLRLENALRTVLEASRSNAFKGKRLELDDRRRRELEALGYLE